MNNKIKRYLGIVWMLLGLASILLLVYSAAININKVKGDIGRPVPWVIIITVFTPVALGLMIFGWYAWKGEYDGEVRT